MLRAACLCSLALLACSGTPLPGTQLGTYKVVGTAQTNSCGLGAPNPWTFDVQLSQDGSMLYWSWMDGSPLVSGTLDSSSHTSIDDTQTGNVDGTDASLGPCTMQRQDDLEITLGSGSFTGSLTYSFTVPTGSDCDDQLAASGGQYTTLPCTVNYSLSASRQ